MEVLHDRFIRLRTVKLPATWFPRGSIAGHLLFARALRLVQNSYAQTSSIFAGPFAMRKAQRLIEPVPRGR
jgi:hypothetical protein